MKLTADTVRTLVAGEAGSQPEGFLFTEALSLAQVHGAAVLWTPARKFTITSEGYDRITDQPLYSYV